jgi:transcription elongation GreA/GreB family factor
MVEPARRLAVAERPIPMTATAAATIRAEVESIEAELQPGRRGPGDASWAAPADGDRLERRLQALRDALEAARIEDDPGTAVLGRRVTVLDEGEAEGYALVLPGDGDPSRGWISIDSPLGAALAGRRSGERARVEAPGGVREVVLVAVE